MLKEELPALPGEGPRTRDNIYYDMRRLLEHTAGKIREHNFNAAARCFALAGSLHEKGNDIVKNTVENVFVYSFSGLLHLAHKEKSKLISVIPASLYALYLSQACHTGY